MASLGDILTSIKNLATGISQIGQQYLSVQGTKTAKNLTTSTLVQQGPGRLCSVIVTDAGSGDGAIHDAISVAQASADNLIWPVYKDATVAAITSAPVVVNLPIKDGLVVIPGSGQAIVVSYS